MQISCEVAALSLACQNVSRAVATKSTMPVMEGILMRTVSEGVELTGYNSDLGIRTVVPCSVGEEGGVVLAAHLLCDILRRMPEGTVELSSDTRQYVTICAGESRFSLMGIPAQDYPELPSVNDGHAIELQQNVLAEMVRQTIFSVSIKADRVVHTGLQFSVLPGQLQLVAVDGVRLAVRRESIPYQGEELQFVVPAKTLAEIIKITDDEEGVVSLNLGKRRIEFALQGYTFISSLLDGEFLDYKTTLPQESTVTAQVNTRRLLEALERTSLMGIADTKLRTPATCLLNEHGIALNCSTAIGTASDRFACHVEGEPLEIGFNNKFLIDALRAADSDEVRIRCNTPVAPILILPTEGESFLYLVLPVRLRTEQ
jgi:DNA polymerase-3 subunit beta